MNSYMFFQMVFELEGFTTFRTLELTEVCTFIMADHVTLQTVNIGEGLVTDCADLRSW